VTAKQPAMKIYVVRLSIEERDRLNALIQWSKAPARQVLKARILLKADASKGGDGWSDQCIADALDTSIGNQDVQYACHSRSFAEFHYRDFCVGSSAPGSLFPGRVMRPVAGFRRIVISPTARSRP